MTCNFSRAQHPRQRLLCVCHHHDRPSTTQCPTRLPTRAPTRASKYQTEGADTQSDATPSLFTYITAPHHPNSLNHPHNSPEEDSFFWSTQNMSRFPGVCPCVFQSTRVVVKSHNFHPFLDQLLKVSQQCQSHRHPFFLTSEFIFPRVFF